MSDCKNTYGPDYSVSTDDPCAPSTSSTDPNCKAWQFTLSSDAAVIDSFVAESMNIASADANVHKLLGVHEQNKIIEGSPDKIKQVIDYWKFTKNILNKSPNWYLSEIVSK